MTANGVNQVLLNGASRIGADYAGWIEGFGGQGLRKALGSPNAIIDLVREAGLLGLGGSGFPAYRKWRFVADQKKSGSKYLICNGNEDEPGTFKDRILLEETPHQVIEGALITALAVGADRIIFYIDPQKVNSITAISAAIEQWEETELFRRVSNALGGDLRILVRQSTGTYTSGEETAAIEVVEGKFPFPRGKPPFPAESGVEGRPTLINNVETLANVCHILRKGARWFRDLGIGDASGTKIYCLSGDISRPGAYELPMGTPLRELVDVYGGGMLPGKRLKAVFTGGPSNTILTAEDLDVALDFSSLEARRSGLGTGAMIVISHGTGIVKRVSEYVNFFAEASCGQCPSCRTGTYYMSMLLEKIDSGQGTRADLDTLVGLSRILPGSGRCHLLDGAVKLIDSSLYHFMGEYEQALRN